MESRAKFNLEKRVENWKTILKERRSLTENDIQELESHLIDLISDLEQKGLSQEESFLVAETRIGKVDEICSEYEKLSKSAAIVNTVTPHFKGALIFIAIIALSKLFSQSFLYLAESLDLNYASFKIVNILLLAFVPLCFFSFAYFSFKKDNSFLKKLNNIPVLITLIIAAQASILLMQTNLIVLTSMSNYKTMLMDFAVYKLLLGIILLTVSFFLFGKNKKDSKIKIVE